MHFYLYAGLDLCVRVNVCLCMRMFVCVRMLICVYVCLCLCMCYCAFVYMEYVDRLVYALQLAIN